MLSLFTAGELLRDPEQRTAKNGNGYATALLRAGEDLVNVTCFDSSLVERLIELRKGDPVSVSGRLTVSAYTDKQGEPKAGLSVTVNELMSAPARTAKAPPRSRPKPGARELGARVEADLNDQVPF